ncbi:hypothetical protein A0O34_11225 [Chryseobacterium glaciei]|uniref:Putative auto-transporter adhesin head GIN domain-containing protein n=1 Tax=Chryseobacterium glaciei TaxID=1685010 RepID=A0A172XVP8_9FLAO|nr:DUF4252 domain-containing protein [Chryseobacterium glaciei]ANF51048.1 hypothetical protein A0O34_11225 [Chryseobacterium glaciei]
MKKILIIFAFAFSHFYNVYGQGDKFDKLFEKYQEVEGVTSIKIAKPMFGMLSSLNIDDAQLDQIKPLLAKINGLKVLITENPEKANSPEGRKVQANLSQLSKDVSSYLKNLNYSEIMSVNNSGAKIKFLSSEAKDGILDDLLLSINSDSGENILVMLDGKLSMDDVNKIINSSETKSNTISHTRNTQTSDNNPSYLNGEARNVGEFSGINVSTGVNVVYKQESPTNIKVIADADKLQYVITKVENGILKVYIDNKGVKNLRFKNLSVNVSSPRMSEIKTSSGANFSTVNSVNENNLTIDASSGSTIKGKFNVSNTTNVEATSGSNIKADVNSKNFELKASSGSDTSFEGEVMAAVFDISSGALCKAENLRSDSVDAESTSGGSLSINVTTTLKVKASSGGLVKYKGNPKIDSNISKMSGGSLKPIN